MPHTWQFVLTKLHCLTVCIFKALEICQWVTKSRNSEMPLQATRNYNRMRSKNRIWIWGLKSLIPKMGETFCLQNSGGDSLERSCVNPG